MNQAIFFEPDEGKAVSARGSLMLFKVVAETTAFILEHLK